MNAEVYFKKSVKVFLFPDNILEYSAFLRTEEKPSEAINLLLSAIKQEGITPTELKTLLISLGACYHDNGCSDEALDCFNKVREIEEETSEDEKKINTATTFYNVGVVHFSEAEYEKSYTAFENAVSIYINLNYKFPILFLPDIVGCYNYFIKLNLQKKDFKNARGHFQDVMKLLEHFFASPRYFGKSSYDECCLTVQRIFGS